MHLWKSQLVTLNTIISHLKALGWPMALHHLGFSRLCLTPVLRKIGYGSRQATVWADGRAQQAATLILPPWLTLWSWGVRTHRFTGLLLQSDTWLGRSQSADAIAASVNKTGEAAASCPSLRLGTWSFIFWLWLYTFSWELFPRVGNCLKLPAWSPHVP